MGSEHVGDQSFSDMWIGGNARVHMGNIYNSPDDGTYEKRLVDWLTSINPSSSHDHACKQYQEGTLSWFFADRRFQKWRDRNEGTSSSVLWCRGEMGTGKTTLIAQILEHLNIRKSCETDSAIVYCRYADRQNQTAENLLGSILAQLYQRIARKFDIPLHVKRCFDKQFSFWTKKPSLGELESWLKWRLENETPVFILLDALDEMEPASRRKLLRSIRSVEHHALRLLVTSRSLPEIGKELWQKEEIWVHAHRQDVVTFISSRLQDDVADEFLDHVLKTPGRQGCLTVKDEILYKVAESAGEMYILNPLQSHLRNESLTMSLGFYPRNSILIASRDVQVSKIFITISTIFLRDWKPCTRKLGREQPRIASRLIHFAQRRSCCG